MKQNLKCLFTSDLHGNESKYDRLFHYIEKFPPDALFLGGDLTRPVMNIRGVNTGNNIFFYESVVYGSTVKKIKKP